MIQPQLTTYEYAEQCGARCPWCLSTSIEGQSIDVDTGNASQEMNCLNCSRSWTDNYVLTGFVVDESTHNATCPFCGAEDQLLGCANLNAGSIPLHPDGYNINEGMPASGELYDIQCGGCDQTVPIEHYLGHARVFGEECDCKPSESDESNG